MEMDERPREATVKNAYKDLKAKIEEEKERVKEEAEEEKKQ